MRATAALLALAAAVSTAPPAFATGATPEAAGRDVPAGGDGAQASSPAARPPGGDDLDLPPEALQKLSPEQITSVLREREQRRATFAGRPPDLAGSLLFFGTLLTVVLLGQVFATRRERIRQDTLRAMVEKGMEIPPGLVGARARRSSDLRNGLVLVGAGLGLSLTFALVRLNGQSGSGLWSIGLVPMLMGAGYLVAWRVDAGNTSGRA